MGEEKKEEIIRKEAGEPECGTNAGKLCSELFKEKYNSEKIKAYILSFIDSDFPDFKPAYELWPRNEDGGFNKKFLETETPKLSGKIFRSLINIEKKAYENNVKFEVKNLDIYVRDKIRSFLRKPIKRPECGTGTNILCSQLFEQRYKEVVLAPDENRSFGKIKNLIFNIIKSGYFKYHEIFNLWTRDKYGDFDSKVLTDQAHGIFEYIKEELEKREKNARKKRTKHNIYSLDSYIRTILLAYFSDQVGYLRQDKPFRVKNRHIKYLSIYGKTPDITIDDLKSLAKKHLSIKEKDLLSKVRTVPGFRKAWFTIQKVEGKNRLIAHHTIEDRLEWVNFLTGTERDLGVKMAKSRSDSDLFDGHSLDYDDDTGRPIPVDSILEKLNR